MLAAGLALGWWRDRVRLEREIEALRNPVRGWDTDQVLGRPDTPGAGDIRTAWASAHQDDQPEWLLLEYRRAVRPRAVLIHETFNPGAVTRVTAFDAGGSEVEVWSGVDPTPTSSARGVSTIPVKVSFRTRRIKIYIDSPAVPGWNEIDAVGLRSSYGRTQWATKAYASSSYGRNNEPYTFGGVTFTR
jgi:hypothetical protein